MQDEDFAHGTLPAGFQFGAYVIGGCIGQGGMARIYRAEHRALRKPVALKVMESVLLERPEGRPRFLREGQAAAAVKHPNVVDITDVGVWQGRPYLVMELLEGEDLERYLSRHEPLAEQDVARIMIPVIAGLITAHSAGVIHRDLKPSNIFLSRGPDGEAIPKLLDFGISKLASSLRTLAPSQTPIGELMGSPMYMSPEAVRGARDLTPLSDQYSLGVILYECVTGRAPFHGDSLLGVLEAVAHGRFESPRTYRPDLSTVLEVAILRAMSRDPADRFPSVRELGRALCEAADHRTRLLWTPSFGLREPLGIRATAQLGPFPSRTGPPLSASVPSAPSTARVPSAPWRRAWTWGLSALALLMLALVGAVYLRPAHAPQRAEVPPGAARPSPRPALAVSGGDPSPSASEPRVAAALPAAAGDAPSAASEEGTPRAPAAERPRPASTPGKARVRKARPGSEPAAQRPRAPRSRAAERERSVRAEAEARAARARPRGPDVDAEEDEMMFPARPAPPARSGPVLGANQSPILD